MKKATPECIIKLKAQYNSLNPATRKVADYILSNPNSVLENNITELAEKIEVSQFSIINCIKTTGYNGYKDFKMSLAKDVDMSVSTNFDEFSDSDDPYTTFKKVSSVKMLSIKDTMLLIDEETFLKAVDMLFNANRIEICGIGYSFFAAEFAAMNLLNLGKIASVQRDPQYQQMSASLLSKGDLAIGFSVSGASSSIVESLETAKSSGAKTIAVTSFAGSPITKHADLTLLTAYGEHMYVHDNNNSIIEQTVLVSALSMSLANKDKTKGLFRSTK